MPRAALLNEMERQGVRQVLGRRCTQILAGGVKVVDRAGTEDADRGGHRLQLHRHEGAARLRRSRAESRAVRGCAGLRGGRL